MGKVYSKDSDSARVNILNSQLFKSCKNHEFIYNLVNTDINKKGQSSELYLKEFICSRFDEIPKNWSDLSFDQRRNKLEIGLKKCFLSMIFMSYSSDPIMWKATDAILKRNIVVFGDIGMGKSTLLNKLAYMLDTKNNGEMEMHFFSA